MSNDIPDWLSEQELSYMIILYYLSGQLTHQDEYLNDLMQNLINEHGVNSSPYNIKALIEEYEEYKNPNN
jgi:hypothetical protein